MSGADWGNGGSYDPNQYGGLLGGGGYGAPSGGGLLSAFAPGALYPQGLFTPQQQQAMAGRGLLAMAGAFGQGAMPSRLPVPIGAVLGSAAGAYGQSQDQAAEEAMKGTLLGLQGQELRAKLGMYNAAMQPPPPMYAPGQGMPGVAPPAGGGGLLSQGAGAGPGGTATGNGLLSGGMGSGAGAGGQFASGMGSPSTAKPQVDDILPMISQYESGGKPYVGYGGADLSKAPLDSTGFPIWEGQQGPEGQSHAAGIYQIQPDLWHKYAPMVGVKDFSPASQDAVARAIYLNEGIAPWASNTRLINAVGGNGAASASAGASTTPPPPPRVASPNGTNNINPDFVGWAQQQARVYTTLGMKAPDYINQAAALPMVGATESAKKSADFTYDAALKAYQNQLDIQKSFQQYHPPVVGRPGATIIDQNTGQRTEVPQYTTGIVAGIPTGGYMTPSGGFRPSGVQSAYTPGEKAGQAETAKNQANLGDYGVPPPGQASSTAALSAPAGNTAPSTGLVIGGATPGAVPGTSPYGGYPSQPPGKAAPALTPQGQAAQTANVPGTNAIDPLKFQTQPYKTASGSVIPPLNTEFRPTAPKAVEAALPDWQKATGEITESVEPAMQAKQRLQTFADMMQDVQSGSFMSHKAQWASDLRGMGLGFLANAIMSAKDAGAVQTAIHENYQSALATLKSSTNRFTQKEFETISENQVSPDLQPAANQQILAENMAFLDRNIQMAQDWNVAARNGWKNPDSFEIEWNRANPMPASVQRAGQQMGQLKGAPPVSGTAAPGAASSAVNSRPGASPATTTAGASTSGPSPFREGMTAGNGAWVYHNGWWHPTGK